MGKSPETEFPTTKSHLDRVVHGSVEETLNALLDAEADRLCNSVTSAARPAAIPGPVTTNASCRPKPARSSCDTQASGADVRDGDHRALPAAGEFGRGGLDRDAHN